MTSTPGAGHVAPLLKFARVLAGMGHEVRLAANSEAGTRIQDAGFEQVVLGLPEPDERARANEGMKGLTGDDALSYALVHFFGRLYPEGALPALREEIRDWRPDLILRESAELAGLVAAREAGLPVARVAVHALCFEEGMWQALGDCLTRLFDMVGVSEDAVGVLKAEPVFSAFPETLDLLPPEPISRQPFRYTATKGDRPAPIARPDWAPVGRKIVYATLGTMAGSSATTQTAFRATLAAAGEIDAPVLMTTGPSLPDGVLGPAPDNVTLRPFVPQDEVFPHAAAVLCHGGSGTLLGSLAAGLPVAVLPLFADQPHNAQAVEAAGAGLAVPKPSPEAIATKLRRVLSEPGHRDGAARVAADIDRLPDIREAAEAVIAVAG